MNVAVCNLSLTSVVKCASIDRPDHPQAACKPRSISSQAHTLRCKSTGLVAYRPKS